MNTLRNLLTLWVTVALAATCIVGTAGLVSEHRMHEASERALVAKDVTADVLPPPLYLVEMRLVLSQALEGTLSGEAAAGQWEQLAKEYGERVSHWRAHPPYGLEAQLLGEQHVQAQRFMAAGREVLAALPDKGAALAALQRAQTVFAAHRQGVDTTVKAATAYADGALEQQRAAADGALWVTVALLAASATVLVALGLWVTRRVFASTGGEPAEVARLARAVAQGDLSVSVPVRPGDDHSVMAAMHGMREGLIGLVAQVRASSGAIATGSREIAAGNLDLSNRTERQAGNLQQTASAMDQFSGTVRQTADTARQASQLAESACDVAARGAEAMRRMVGTMSAISDSSKKIAEITGLIDGIAFQTNILALNAAVEAARAGEQGRGFAVVAAEVRSLAQRSAAAAREINGLISSSGESVQAGAAQVAQAGSTMDDIVCQVRRVTDLIGDISSATSEQTSGIGLVSQAVTELDGSTQQNTALVEQSAAAAAALERQACELVRAVSAFKMDAAGAEAVPA